MQLMSKLNAKLVVCGCSILYYVFMCVCVVLGEKEETALPESRTCSAGVPPPLNLASSTITAYPEIITEAPSPTKICELGGIQMETRSNGRKTSDLATLLEVGSPPSFPGHRHSKSMDGKSSFKWGERDNGREEGERGEESKTRDCLTLLLTLASLNFLSSGLIRPFRWLR